MQRIASIDGNATDEAGWLRRGVDPAVSDRVWIRRVRIHGHEQSAAARAHPQRRVLRGSAADTHNVGSRLISAVSAAGQIPRGRAQSSADRYPVPARNAEVAEVFVAVLIEIRARSTVIRRTPDMLQSDEERTRELRIRDEGDIERGCLAAQLQ